MKVFLFLAVGCLVCAPSAADEVLDCLAIESAVERLDCYDRIARSRAAAQTPPAPDVDRPATDPVTGPPVRLEAEEQLAVEPSRSPPSHRAVATDDDAGAGAEFGKPERRAASSRSAHIQARIESVQETPVGRRVVTLSNGQVWMENEAGRRPIEPDQEVVIRKRRWNYVMVMQSQPNIPVHRIE